MLVARERLDQSGVTLRRILERYRAVLVERNVALLVGSGFVSEIGDWFNIVALISLSYRLGGGAFGVGGMLAARMLISLVLQGPAGAFVDRHPGRRVLFLSQVAMALVASSFAVLPVVPELWLLYLLVILLEAANCVGRPAFMVVLKAEAPPDQLSLANGALFASMTTAQLVGPVLGGLVLVSFGAGPVFALNGLTFLGIAFAVSQLRGGLNVVKSIEVPVDPSDAEAITAESPAALGYRWLLRRQDLSLYVLVCLSLALLVQATITLFIERAGMLGLGDSGVGIFYTAVAVGSIVGSVVGGTRAQRATPLYAAAVAMGLCAVALAAFGIVATILLAIATLVIAGFATDFYEVVGLTYFQQSIPEGVYGRFFSIFLMALSAGSLVGALAGPALEQIVGIAAALGILALPALALALALAITSRSRQTPAQELSP